MYSKLILFTGMIALSSCSSQEIFKVDHIEESKNDDRVNYHLVTESGNRVILKQKKSKSLTIGSKIVFE